MLMIKFVINQYLQLVLFSQTISGQRLIKKMKPTKIETKAINKSYTNNRYFSILTAVLQAFLSNLLFLPWQRAFLMSSILVVINYMQSQSNLEGEVFKAKKQKQKLYLDFLTIAIAETSQNRGSLRKQIWEYLVKDYKEIDYRDFLVSIQEFVKSGKLICKNGYYFLEGRVYEEMLKNRHPTTAASFSESQDTYQKLNSITRRTPSRIEGKTTASRKGIQPPSSVTGRGRSLKIDTNGVVQARPANSVVAQSLVKRATQVKIDRFFQTHSTSRAFQNKGQGVSRDSYPELPDPMMNVKRPNIIKERSPSSEQQSTDARPKASCLGFADTPMININPLQIHKITQVDKFDSPKFSRLNIVARSQQVSPSKNLEQSKQTHLGFLVKHAQKAKTESIELPDPVSSGVYKKDQQFKRNDQAPASAADVPKVKKPNQIKKQTPIKQKINSLKTPTKAKRILDSPKRQVIQFYEKTPSPTKKEKMESPRFNMQLRSSAKKTTVPIRGKLDRSKMIKKAQTQGKNLMRELFVSKNFTTPNKSKQSKLLIVDKGFKLGNLNEESTRFQTKHSIGQVGTKKRKVSAFDDGVSIQSTTSRAKTKKRD